MARSSSRGVAEATDDALNSCFRNLDKRRGADTRVVLFAYFLVAESRSRAGVKSLPLP